MDVILSVAKELGFAFTRNRLTRDSSAHDAGLRVTLLLI